MKKFRRLAALLLAGAMALMMFTGCSNSAFEREIENELLKQFNAQRTSVSTAEEPVSELQNDSALHQTALQMLDKIDPESGLVDSNKVAMYGYAGSSSSKEEAYTWIKIYIRENAYVSNSSIPVAITAETLKSFDLLDFMDYDLTDESDIRYFKKITAFTVAARTIGDKTYLAIGYTESDTFD